MTAEAEVCNGAVSEVAGIEEKREFKTRSFQDLAKPELDGIGNHDQAGDPEDSYVLVTDVGDPSAGGKDMAAVDGSPRHESSAPGEFLGTELDARNGNPEGTNVGKHGNAEAGDSAMDGSPRHESSVPGELLGTRLDPRIGIPEGANVGTHALVNGSPDVQVISIVDGGGNQDTLEEEHKCSVELNDHNGKIDVMNGEVDPTSREGKIGNSGSTAKNPSVADDGVLVGVEGSVRDEDEIQDKLVISKPEFEAESEIKKAEDSNGKIESSEEAKVEKFEDQNGKIGVVAVAEPDSVEENSESKVPSLKLVADSSEEDEPNNLLSPSDVQETVEDEAASALGKEAMQVEDEAESALGKEAVQGQKCDIDPETALGKEAMQGQKCDIDPETDVQHGLDKDKVVESTADCNVGTACGEVLESFVSDNGVSNSMLESVDVKAMVGGATGIDGETLLSAKNGDAGNSCSLGISKASPESSSDTVTEVDVSGVAVTKPLNFFVRIPRYSDEKLQEQIRIAELEVNEKTKLRDSIQAQIQNKRAKNQNYSIGYEYAKGEGRSVKKLLKEKRMEIDSLQSIINKAKNAISIEDLNIRIKTSEQKIQHETLPLREEKQLIHNIKILKQLREQLSSSKCSQNENQQALEQREQAEERLKTLRKELGNLKDTASKAQTACDEAESKYSVEEKKVKELQAQFRAADDVRQEAYAKFLSLSKELSQKRKNFFKFKNDSAAATYYAFTDDREALYRHCVNEVENFMELWNGNEEFRSEYVRLNTRSTLRRFGTLDGRSLGPDEKPIILPSYVSKRIDKVVSVPANSDSISNTPTIELNPETKIENVSSDIHSSKKETESKVKRATTEGPAKSKQVHSLVTVSGMDEEKVEVQEEPVKTKEELELVRKAEEIRREEAEAKMKEQRRLEEMVKAKEARERKQRRDEKSQKREELKARKEAEQKEKEREKKSRKKEQRKAASTSTSAPMGVQDDASSITCVEISKEEASTKVSDVSKKKPKTSRVMVSKQNKTRSMPPPSLRNRNRRKWQQWMWASLISLTVLVLFWLGNMGVFSNVNSKLQGIAGF